MPKRPKKLSPEKLKKKDLFVFDLDGTLIRTKSPMEPDMAKLITQLLLTKKVAVIGGAKYSIFQELLVRKLKCPKHLLKNLFLFPATGTLFYRYNHGWKKIYALSFNTRELTKIRRAFLDVFKEIGYKHPKKTYGKIIENRGGEVAFSVYGQDVVRVLGNKGVEMKERWLRDNFKLKMKITKLVAKKLPDLEVRAAGFTTIDVTPSGVDKEYGIYQMRKYLKIPIKRMFFLGDAIFPGGNDYAVIKTGVDYMSVKGPKETKQIIKKILYD